MAPHERRIVGGLLLSISLALVMFGGYFAGNSDFFRTHATAWTSAILTTPALCIFVVHFRREGLGDWWRLFWMLGWTMIVIHFYFGLGVMHFWNPISVFERQGFLVAGPIFLLQGVWLVDILLTFLRRDWRRAQKVYAVWQLFVWLIAYANFFVSLVVFRNDTESLVIGLAMSAAVIISMMHRFFCAEGDST